MHEARLVLTMLYTIGALVVSCLLAAISLGLRDQVSTLGAAVLMLLAARALVALKMARAGMPRSRDEARRREEERSRRLEAQAAGAVDRLRRARGRLDPRDLTIPDGAIVRADEPIPLSADGRGPTVAALLRSHRWRNPAPKPGPGPADRWPDE